MKNFKYLFLTLFILSGFNLSAQNVITGRIKNKLTKEKIELATVRNLKQGFTTATDSLGEFRIRGNQGDSIVVSSLGYGTDTLVVNHTTKYEIFLNPSVNMLAPVTLKIINMKPIALPTSPFHGQRVVYQYNYGSKNIGGIAIRVWEGKSSEKKKAEQAEKVKELAQEEQIKNWFNADTLSRFIPLKGEHMKKFIELYTPSLKAVKEYGGNILLYINDSYKKFEAKRYNTEN